MAAEFATPGEDRVLPAAHVRRDLRTGDVGAGPSAGAGADGAAEHREPAHGVPRHRRLPPRHDDWHLGSGPGGHHPRPRRPGDASGRPAAARPHLPARGPRRRRAEAGRAHRGRHRPCPDGRVRARRRALRDRQRGQARHGPAARARGVLRPARAAVDLDRRPHPLPPAHREAGPPRRHGPAVDDVGTVRLRRLRVGARRQPPRRVRPR